MLTQCRKCGEWYWIGAKHACFVPTQPLGGKISYLAYDPPPSASTIKMVDENMNDLVHLKDLQGAPIAAPVITAWNCMADNIKEFKVDGKFHKAVYDKARTLADFCRLQTAGQYELINAGWRSIVYQAEANLKFRDMAEPPHPKLLKSFPTSAFYEKALLRFGIGFRCDKRDAAKVRDEGFKPLYHRDPPMNVRNTIMASGKMYMWLSNRDTVGETAVCVSRTLAGCTKFPKPSDDGVYHVYAVRPQQENHGFDTEVWQEHRVWRPGEKAFPIISAGEVIAHVEVRKHGSGGGNCFYRYEFAADAAWEFFGATSDEVDYLKGELVPLRGGIREVSKNDDFAAENEDRDLVGKERLKVSEYAVRESTCDICKQPFASLVKLRLHKCPGPPK